MKKLMIIAAVAMAAVAAQAASFNWNTANTAKITDGEGAAITTTAGYDALMNGGSIVLVLLGEGNNWGNATVLDAGTNGNAAKVYTGSPNSKKGTLTGTYMFDGASGVLSDGDVLGVMYKDADGNLSKLLYADGTEVSTTYTISGLDAAGDTWTGTAFTFASGQNFTTAVPEPTSGLLLLLGMAGLALRRKQA